MLFRNRTLQGLLAISFLLGTSAIAGCSSSDSGTEPSKTVVVQTSGTQGQRIPVELEKVVRRDRGAYAETLVAVPKTFILSFECNSAGEKALSLVRLPPSATATAQIQANGQTVAKGNLDDGQLNGPFLDEAGTQIAVIRQITSAQEQVSKVKVKFDRRGQCRVDDFNLKVHRNS